MYVKSQQKIVYLPYICDPGDEEWRWDGWDVRCREHTHISHIMHLSVKHVAYIAKNYGIKIHRRKKISEQAKMELAKQILEHPFNNLRNPERPSFKKFSELKTRKRDKKKNLAAQQRLRAKETEAQRTERLEKSKLRMRKLRCKKNKTVDQIIIQRKKWAEQKQKERHRESVRRRNQRLSKLRERYKKKRENETPEETTKRLKHEAARRWKRKIKRSFICPVCTAIFKTKRKRAACIGEHTKCGIRTNKEYMEVERFIAQEISKKRWEKQRKAIDYFKRGNSDAWIMHYFHYAQQWTFDGRRLTNEETEEYLDSFVRQHHHETTKQITLQISRKTAKDLNSISSESDTKLNEEVMSVDDALLSSVESLELMVDDQKDEDEAREMEIDF